MKYCVAQREAGDERNCTRNFRLDWIVRFSLLLGDIPNPLAYQEMEKEA